MAKSKKKILAKTHLGRPAVYLAPGAPGWSDHGSATFVPWCVEVETEWGLILKRASNPKVWPFTEVRYRIIRNGTRARGELMSAAEAQALFDRNDAVEGQPSSALRPRVGDYVAFTIDNGAGLCRGSVIEVEGAAADILLDEVCEHDPEDEVCEHDPEAGENGRMKRILLEGLLVLSRPDEERAS